MNQADSGPLEEEGASKLQAYQKVAPMNGSPIKPVSARVETPTTPLPSSVSGSPRVGESVPSADAASVSVASTKSRGITSNDPSEAVDSLLKGIESSSNLAEAHGRLDPARVFGLLSDDTEESEE